MALLLLLLFEKDVIYMSAIQKENIEYIGHKTCEYNGATYFIIEDMKTKRCFIEVDGKRLYLDRNGNVANSQPGGRNVKDCVDSYEDMAKIYNHLLEQKRWNIYLLYVLNYNLSRRIGDLLASKWSDFFDERWRLRNHWSLIEKKTGKKNDIKLNKAVRIAFKTFFENETAFEKSKKLSPTCNIGAEVIPAFSPIALTLSGSVTVSN